MVGLGNPGKEYDGTRHNLGADVVALIARRHSIVLRSGKEHALTGDADVDGYRLALGIPQTYMNLSGEAVRALVKRHGIDSLDALIVVHDELDLDVGRIQIKSGGGLAGHNGLKSIKQHLHDDAFVRIRIGVGRPDQPGPSAADYVLRRPGAGEQLRLTLAVDRAADAADAILAKGVANAMDAFNARD